MGVLQQNLRECVGAGWGHSVHREGWVLLPGDDCTYTTLLPSQPSQGRCVCCHCNPWSYLFVFCCFEGGGCFVLFVFLFVVLFCFFAVICVGWRLGLFRGFFKRGGGAFFFFTVCLFAIGMWWWWYIYFTFGNSVEFSKGGSSSWESWCEHGDVNVYIWAGLLKHAHTHTHTHTHTHVHTQKLTHTWADTLPHTQTHALTHAQSVLLSAGKHATSHMTQYNFSGGLILIQQQLQPTTAREESSVRHCRDSDQSARACAHRLVRVCVCVCVVSHFYWFSCLA